MARNDTPANGNVDDQASAEVATITNHALLTKFAEMVTMIPAEDGNGTENILAQILGATKWEQLDEPWDATDVDDIIGRRLKLTRATRRPSTIGGGLGIFLVVHLEDPSTGATFVKTTGSIAVVGQIVAAYARNWMPLLVEWRKSDRPTEQGYYPQHLIIHDSFATSGDAAS